MSDVTNDLMLEILKNLQAGQVRTNQILEDLLHSDLKTREEVHSLGGNDLRIERQLAEVRV